VRQELGPALGFDASPPALADLVDERPEGRVIAEVGDELIVDAAQPPQPWFAGRFEQRIPLQGLSPVGGIRNGKLWLVQHLGSDGLNDKDWILCRAGSSTKAK